MIRHLYWLSLMLAFGLLSMPPSLRFQADEVLR